MLTSIEKLKLESLRKRLNAQDMSPSEAFTEAMRYDEMRHTLQPFDPAMGWAIRMSEQFFDLATLVEKAWA